MKTPNGTTIPEAADELSRLRRDNARLRKWLRHVADGAKHSASTCATCSHILCDVSQALDGDAPPKRREAMTAEELREIADRDSFVQLQLRAAEESGHIDTAANVFQAYGHRALNTIPNLVAEVRRLVKALREWKCAACDGRGRYHGGGTCLYCNGTGLDERASAAIEGYEVDDG